MEESRVLDHLRQSKALLEGHFLLSSGLHSNRYFQCARVLQYPDRAGELAGGLAHAMPWAIDVVVGPALGAVVWSQEVGRALGCRALFTERQGGEMTLRRGFEIDPSERVLVVEDVVTTGRSAREAIDVVRGFGAQVVGVGSIVNRSGGNPFEDLGLELQALCEVEVHTWEADDCPLCAEGRELVKPGSRPGSAA